MKRPLTIGLLFLSCASTAASTAAAQVVLKPNQITGNVGFSNTDPLVVGILKDLGPLQVYLAAQSVAPPSFSATLSLAWPSNDLVFPYQMSANAAGGVTYGLDAQAVLFSAGANPGSRYYHFDTLPPPGFLPDPDVDPAGLALDIFNCVGLVHLKWGADAACDALVGVNGAEVSDASFTDYLEAASSNYLVVPGGLDKTVRLVTRAGADPTTDQVRIGMDLPISVGCDEIQEVCIDASGYGAGGGALGAFSGPFDIVGETQTGATYVAAYWGPDGNLRYRYPTPSAGWTLPNLPPGDYHFVGATAVRTGRQANYLTTRSLAPETAIAGVTSHLEKTVNGEQRLPLVMTPATMSGSVRLADPYVVANPGATSPLSALRFSTDTGSLYPTQTQLAVQSVQGNASFTSFPGAFDAAAGDLLSSYEAVLVNPYDETDDWRAVWFGLVFDDVPANRSGSVYVVNSSGASSPLAPGQTATFDHRYCFNEITLGYVAENGTFTAPRAELHGGFDGTDWEGNAKQYSVGGHFYGQTPENEPATTADVRITVPQGSFTVIPFANVGGTSASFPEVHVTAGCGQRLTLTAGLAVSLDQLDACPSAAGTLPVSGSVDSQGQEVSRIWYKINGGPDVDLCSSNCGANPAFAGTAQLPPGCASTIEVFASSASVALPASSAGTVDACAEACPSNDCQDAASVPVECATVQRGLFSEVADSDIDIDYGTWAAGGTPFVWTGFSPHAHRSLTSFDVSFIPRGSTVVSATASWYVMWNTDHQITRAHKVLDPWDEATVTWLDFGAESHFDAPVLGSFDAFGLGWKSIGLTGMYQDIVSCAAPDHGVILESDVPPDAPTVAHTYAASEASSNRPKLEICWVPACHPGCNP